MKKPKQKKQGLKRVYHTWEKWECYPAGFYETKHKTMSEEECREEYRAFLSDLTKFRRGLVQVILKWKISCEHYLTNSSMNRIAWLGQASACIMLGIPAKYRAGYFLLTQEQRVAADNLALEYLNIWLKGNDAEKVDKEGAGANAQVNLY